MMSTATIEFWIATCSGGLAGFVASHKIKVKDPLLKNIQVQFITRLLASGLISGTFAAMEHLTFNTPWQHFITIFALHRLIYWTLH